MSIKHCSNSVVIDCDCGKGPHGPYCAWCGDEWPCDYYKLERSKNFIAGLKNDAEDEVRRLENIIIDLEVYLAKVGPDLELQAIIDILEER